jgi:hypothetical protein
VSGDHRTPCNQPGGFVARWIVRVVGDIEKAPEASDVDPNAVDRAAVAPSAEVADPSCCAVGKQPRWIRAK